MKQNDGWSSRAGFLLSAIGSAVGLGNIWRFPYVVYKNGGGAFFLPYLAALVTAGFPLMILEYAVGRRYRGATPTAFVKADRRLSFVGWLPVFTTALISVYYACIISWFLNYLLLAFRQGWGEDTNSFFFQTFLQKTDPGGDPVFLPYILFAIAAVWLATWLICYRGVAGGIERVNKILLPTLFVMIVFITVRSLFMEGAAEGLRTLIMPDFGRMADFGVWRDAYGQVFYSLSLAFGVMVTYSAYLPERSDITGGALATVCANSVFEIICATGVFAILGFLSQSSDVPMQEVATEGIGLAFVVFPEAFRHMGGAGNLMGVLFFTSLLFAGLTSIVSMAEAVCAPLMERWHLSRKMTITVVCGILGGFSCLFATGSGSAYVDMMDYFANTFPLILAGLLETLAVGWVIGCRGLRQYINEVSVIRIGRWWEVCVRYVIPAALGIMLLTGGAELLTNGYGGYPKGILYSVMAACALVIAAAVAICSIQRKS